VSLPRELPSSNGVIERGGWVSDLVAPQNAIENNSNGVMLELGSSGLATVLSLWCIVAWGLWPVLRSKCGASVPAFALLNICTQAICAIVWALTLGTLIQPSHGPQFTEDLDRMFRDGVSIRDGAVFLGGFCLGHGDHLSALAMEHLPGGVVYPLYAGFIVAAGGVLNYIQVQPSSPPLMFTGFCLALAAIFFLALAEHANQKLASQSEPLVLPADDPLGTKYELLHRAGGGTKAEIQVDVQAESKLHTSSSNHSFSEESSQAESKLTFKQALLLTLAAGVCACVWSPLSTYGTGGDEDSVESNAYVCLFVFACGQLVSLPSVAFISSRISHTGMFTPCLNLTPNAVKWGVICGISVSSGYLAFFLSSEAASAAATVVFGIAHCNPMVALLIEVLWMGTFRGGSSQVKLYLSLTICLYCVAIGVLMLSNHV
jgi:multidrug transporter EmrE-like cation transporter